MTLVDRLTNNPRSRRHPSSLYFSALPSSIWRVACALLLLDLAGVRAATEQGEAWVLAVSKPSAPLLPSDPPQGLIFRAPFDLGYAEPLFSTEGGPVDLGYLVFAESGAGYLTFEGGDDAESPGGVMVVPQLRARAGEGFDPLRDRVITGSAVGLAEPKDLLLAAEHNAVVVADFSRAELRVFNKDAVGDAPPRFVVDDLGGNGSGELDGEPRRPWGLFYDEAADRLFVGATDGVVVVFDDFFVRRGEGGPDRRITPTLDGVQASVNLHELVVLPEDDLLIALDVGAATTPDEAGFDSDGMILVLENASTADGDTPLRLRVSGPASSLGNPVGLAWKAPSLFVTESARHLILRFDALLEHRGDLELAPDAAVTVVSPESVVLVAPHP